MSSGRHHAIAPSPVLDPLSPDKLATWISLRCISPDTLTGSDFRIQHLSQHAMILLRDYQGLEVRLTEERLEHILEHPEMTGSEGAIQETLRNPDRVLESLFDTEARL